MLTMPAHIPPNSSSAALPLILITNDDGIDSPGLQAAAQAALPLGEVLVVAPSRQWSGAGRSIPHNVSGDTSRYPLEIDGRPIPAYQVDASPALVVIRAVVGLAPRRPSLLLSGINYGENMGADVTVSGTVGAALQGAVFGIPALAVSLQTPQETHANPAHDTDFSTAIHFARKFAKWMLEVSLPFDVDVIKVDVPKHASPVTPWRLTRVSRSVYFVPRPTAHTLDNPSPSSASSQADREMGYQELLHPEHTEPDSDIYALAVEHAVSVAPLSFDLSSRVDFGEMEALLHDSEVL
jgi:5'-nucleotidase